MTTLAEPDAVNPPRSAFCRGGRRRGCTPTRNGRPFPAATSHRSCRLSSVLRTSEGSTSSRFAHDWQAPLLAGALHPSTKHCRVRDIFRDFDTSPRGCSQGQRRRTPHRQRIRANEDSACAPKPCCRRSVRFGGNSRRRCAGNTCPRSARLDRFCSPRRSEESLSVHTLLVRRPLACRCSCCCRQR